MHLSSWLKSQKNYQDNSSLKNALTEDRQRTLRVLSDDGVEIPFYLKRAILDGVSTEDFAKSRLKELAATDLFSDERKQPSVNDALGSFNVGELREMAKTIFPQPAAKVKKVFLTNGITLPGE